MSFDEQPDPLSDCMEAYDKLKAQLAAAQKDAVSWQAAAEQHARDAVAAQKELDDIHALAHNPHAGKQDAKIAVRGLLNKAKAAESQAASERQRADDNLAHAEEFRRELESIKEVRDGLLKNYLVTLYAWAGKEHGGNFELKFRGSQAALTKALSELAEVREQFESREYLLEKAESRAAELQKKLDEIERAAK